MLGDFEEMLSFSLALPISVHSSSLTILITIWAGLRASSTSAPLARSVTVRVKSFTTL